MCNNPHEWQVKENMIETVIKQTVYRIPALCFRKHNDALCEVWVEEKPEIKAIGVSSISAAEQLLKDHPEVLSTTIPDAR